MYQCHDYFLDYVNFNY